MGAIEIHIYTPTSQSWKLHLIQYPFPQSHWKSHWQTLQETYPIGKPDFDIQNQIINHYLVSDIDFQATQDSFQSFLTKYNLGRLEWISKS